jgi:hypothetical protein
VENLLKVKVQITQSTFANIHSMGPKFSFSGILEFFAVGACPEDWDPVPPVVSHLKHQDGCQLFEARKKTKSQM